MSALPLAAMGSWDFVMSAAPGTSKSEDKVTYFFAAPPVNGKSPKTTSPCFVMGTTRVAFPVRPGTINEKSPERMGTNTMLNVDIDVPADAMKDLRAFDDTVRRLMEKKVQEMPAYGKLVWHGLVHEPRTGSGYDATASYRIQGWADFVSRVHSRPVTYKGVTKMVPGSVDWASREHKAQPLREKETSFYRYARILPTGEITYRPHVNGHLVSPEVFVSGTLVRVVFSVTHVLLTLKDQGTSSAEAHASVILAAKEVYEQPKLANSGGLASGIPLMPGVVFEDEEEGGAGAGAFSSSTVLAQSPPSKRAKLAESSDE